MPKQTLAVILALTAVAALLIGINIGKKLDLSFDRFGILRCGGQDKDIRITFR